MTKPRTSTVFRFVILIAVVNLFADFIYEGARSITGPFLAQLGATAAIISILSGAGEFVVRCGARCRHGIRDSRRHQPTIRPVSSNS